MMSRVDSGKIVHILQDGVLDLLLFGVSDVLAVASIRLLESAA
jgi:hypothetical protein